MIIDDDIQYLGCSLSQRIPQNYAQRTVSGITLHIEKSDNNDPYILAFTRDKSSTITIGRRPGTEIESRTLEQDKGKALFRCAVVSRRHAKIAFSDSGNVYLIDLGSHHGTHVRKPGETSSRVLQHEVPTPLSDGDIITFGKSVGRNDEMVRPVVTRVELRYTGGGSGGGGPSSATPIRPLVVPDISPSPSSPTNNKSHSGRYGLHSPSSSSSDDAYSVDSDIYSDIEEIPPPPPSLPPAAPAPPVPVSHEQQQQQQQQQSESQSKTTESHLGRALEVLKRLLPPTTTPSLPPQQQQQQTASSSRLGEQSPIIIHSVSPSPPTVASLFTTGGDGSSPSPSSDLPPFWSFHNHNHNHPSTFSSLLPRFSSSSVLDLSDDFFDLPPFNPVAPLTIHEEEEDNDDNNDNDNEGGSSSRSSSRERSESPMDLASPSPPPPLVMVDREEDEEDQLYDIGEGSSSLGGVWFSRLSSSEEDADADAGSSSAESSEPIATPKDNSVVDSEENGRRHHTAEEGEERSSSPSTPAAQQPAGNREAAAASSASAIIMNHDMCILRFPSPPPVTVEKEKGEQEEGKGEIGTAPVQQQQQQQFVTISQYEDLQSKYTKLQNELETIQTQRRKYKQKFNTNVHTVTSKFYELEDKFTDINAQYSTLSDQMEGVVCGDVPELQVQVGELMNGRQQREFEVEDLRRRVEEVERGEEVEKEEGREMLEELREEKEDLREYVDTLHEEMEMLRTKTEQTVEVELNSLRELRASILEEVATLKSLKRKRSDDIDEDDDDDDDDSQDLEGDVGSQFVPLTLAEEDETQAMSCIDFHQQQQLLSPDRPSRRKRARKIVSVAAQTATAVTMGAVVTWVALAFS